METINQTDLTVIKQVVALQNQSIKQLEELWYKLFDCPPAVYSKPHMIGKLAYKIQELAYGGVDERTEAKIQAAERDVSRPKKILKKKYMPMIGTKIEIYSLCNLYSEILRRRPGTRI